MEEEEVEEDVVSGTHPFDMYLLFSRACRGFRKKERRRGVVVEWWWRRRGGVLLVGLFFVFPENGARNKAEREGLYGWPWGNYCTTTK